MTLLRCAYAAAVKAGIQMRLEATRPFLLCVCFAFAILGFTCPEASATPNVLIVISDGTYSASPVVAELTSQGFSVTVDSRCGGTAPALATLQQYDVVIAWTNCGVDGVSWGNALGNYVDAGGRVILATFAWYGPWFDFEGKISDRGYSPFDWQGASLYSWSGMGTYDAGHPLMTGVSAVTAFYRDNVSVDPGATLVASWADGKPFVGVNANCTVVGISAFPGFSWTGDLMKIFSNGAKLFTDAGACDYRPNRPPIADAGPDQSVSEGIGVTLDGAGSTDADSDPLTYWWEQIGGTSVTLSDYTSAAPVFTAPLVPQASNETLTFRLTVTDRYAASDSDTVNVTVVNVNHSPVADADDDQSVAEGSVVLLDGTNSYDVDGDTLIYSWLQVSGPEVTLNDASLAAPSFTAPVMGTGGQPGVVATVTFTLTVSDGYGGTANDTVTIDITNTNNPPVADAGVDQTKSENSAVSLNGMLSIDPDGDAITYAWVQIGGPSVTLGGATTATPSLTTPFVAVGGADLTFRLTVNDGYGGTATDIVVVHVQNANDPPLVSAAQPTIACLWPPDHKLVQVGIIGVSDPDQNAVITITGVTQDEPTNGLGDGDTAIDAVINGDGTVMLRAERAGNGNGRVYRISFTASDFEGSAPGVVTVCVPRDRKSPAIDSGGLYNSTE